MTRKPNRRQAMQATAGLLAAPMLPVLSSPAAPSSQSPVPLPPELIKSASPSMLTLYDDGPERPERSYVISQPRQASDVVCWYSRDGKQCCEEPFHTRMVFSVTSEEMLASLVRDLFAAWRDGRKLVIETPQAADNGRPHYEPYYEGQLYPASVDPDQFLLIAFVPTTRYIDTQTGKPTHVPEDFVFGSVRTTYLPEECGTAHTHTASWYLKDQDA